MKAETEEVIQLRFHIYDLRKNGLTQAEIAKELGLSQPMISLHWRWVDEALGFHHMVQGEEERSGNPSIDHLEEQALLLELAQRKLKPGTREYLAHSEQISWIRLKAAELRAATCNPADGKTEFNFISKVDVWPRYHVELRKTTTDDLTAELVKFGRVQAVTCPECEVALHAELKLQTTAQQN